jgi:hypothetical protein
VRRRGKLLGRLPGFIAWVQEHQHQVDDGELGRLAAERVQAPPGWAPPPAWYTWRLWQLRQRLAREVGASAAELARMADAAAEALEEARRESPANDWPEEADDA